MPDEPDDYFGRLLARHAPAPPDGLPGAAGAGARSCGHGCRARSSG